MVMITQMRILGSSSKRRRLRSLSTIILLRRMRMIKNIILNSLWLVQSMIMILNNYVTIPYYEDYLTISQVK